MRRMTLMPAYLALALGLATALLSAPALALEEAADENRSTVILADVEHGLALFPPDAQIPDGIQITIRHRGIKSQLVQVPLILVRGTDEDFERAGFGPRAESGRRPLWFDGSGSYRLVLPDGTEHWVGWGIAGPQCPNGGPGGSAGSEFFLSLMNINRRNALLVRGEIYTNSDNPSYNGYGFCEMEPFTMQTGCPSVGPLWGHGASQVTSTALLYKLFLHDREEEYASIITLTNDGVYGSLGSKVEPSCPGQGL